MIGPPPATPRAFSGKVESGGIPKEARIGFKIPTGTKGASHEWRSHTPMTCVNAPLRRLNPGIPAKKLPSCTTCTVGGFIRRKRETGSVSPAKFGGHKTFVLAPHTDLVRKLVGRHGDAAALR